MQCPSCKETIDDDSRYCDQCGEQLMVCSVCGRPGKGKRCIFDGKEMIPAGGGAGTAAQPPTQTDHIDSPLPPVTPPTPQPAQQGSPAVAGDKIKLSSPSKGVMIEVQDGGIIGRKNGPFAGIFTSFTHVSGTHCRITKKNGAWHIEDMGSTNGTFYNGNRLTPNAPIPVANNTTVKIADVELLISYDTNDGGTTRI